VPKFLLFCILIIGTFGCSQRSLDPLDDADSRRLVRQYGSDQTFDIATWNIERFPLQGRTTVSYLAQLIRDIDIDMIGIQEIGDADFFASLLDSLPGYAGFLSGLPQDNLKLGILYKHNFISVSTPYQIFTDDSYAFPRPPFVTYVEIRDQDRIVFDFTLIVNHLKAFGDEESRDRRRAASEKLKTYIDTNILPSDDADCISLGDYNDQLDNVPSQNVFSNFLSDSLNYRFLTYPLIGEASFIGSQNSLIDHLLISNDSLNEYANGSTEILYLEREFELYTTYISDHRPVLARFPVF
jgi:endonuclease/exonuclease/phosphatase family metal-dependent hydrolase